MTNKEDFEHWLNTYRTHYKYSIKNRHDEFVEKSQGGLSELFDEHTYVKINHFVYFKFGVPPYLYSCEKDYLELEDLDLLLGQSFMVRVFNIISRLYEYRYVTEEELKEGVLNIHAKDEQVLEHIPDLLHYFLGVVSGKKERNYNELMQLKQQEEDNNTSMNKSLLGLVDLNTALFDEDVCLSLLNPMYFNAGPIHDCYG